MYIQHVVTRNKFTSFRDWKLETLTFLSIKKNLHTTLLRTIIFFSCKQKLSLYCYIIPVIPFVSKDFVFLLLRWSIPQFMKHKCTIYFIFLPFSYTNLCFSSVSLIKKRNIFQETHYLSSWYKQHTICYRAFQ